MHEVGGTILEKLLNSDGGDYRGRTLPCERGHVFDFKEYRSKEVLTVLGPVTIQRRNFIMNHGGRQFPAAQVLVGGRHLFQTIGTFGHFDS
jgi:hypothetical protein